MPAQRKYIILAFVVFALVFLSIYFMRLVFSTEKQRSDAVGEFYHRTADTSKQYKDGKILFQNKCASCHILGKNFTGSDLTGFTDRGPWTVKKKVLEYLSDPNKFYNENRSEYIENLYKHSEVKHPSFSIIEEELNSIISYITLWNK